MEMTGYQGRTVGSWRLLRLLGEGAFGAVFAAEHTGIAGRAAAVKILRPELSMQAGIKQRFLNEASAASRAEHENIVQIFDGGITPDGTCFSVMELLRGETLSQVIAKGRLDTQRTINVGVQIASALQAAHALHIVHRDLKPDNIFITPRNTNQEFVKVLDFGVAKLRGDQPTDAKLTSTGMIIGTSAYMSPEQWMGHPDVDGRSDIYSLGVILFECLAGTRPFHGDTSSALLLAHIQHPPPDLRTYGVPQQMNQVVQRLLAKEPAQRPQTMQEVVAELHAAARGQQPAATQLSGQGPTVVAQGYAAQPVQQAWTAPAQQQVAAPQQQQMTYGAPQQQQMTYGAPQQGTGGVWGLIKSGLATGGILALAGVYYLLKHWGGAPDWLRGLLNFLP